MQLTIRSSSEMKPGFRSDELEQFLRSSFERYQHRLRQVSVYLDDANGPRGGVDQQCRCVLQLKRMPPIVIQDKDENLGALVHRVVNRAVHALRQKTGKKIALRQRGSGLRQSRPSEVQDDAFAA